MISSEHIAQLLGRSLDDDQESRRSLLEDASASEPVRFWGFAPHHGRDPDVSARLAAEKIVADLAPLSDAPGQGWAGAASERINKIEQIIHEAFRYRLAPPPTLREHLLSLSREQRREIVESFVQDAHDSCAYEGIALETRGMADQIEADLEALPLPPRPLPR